MMSKRGQESWYLGVSASSFVKVLGGRLDAGGPQDIFILVCFFHPISFSSMSTPNKTGLELMGKAAISKLG